MQWVKVAYTTVIPGISNPRFSLFNNVNPYYCIFRLEVFFFILTTLILSSTIDVKHADVNAHIVIKSYFLEQPLFLTKAQMPCKSE